MTAARTFPGMVDSAKEYFNHDADVMVIHNGTVKPFEDLEFHPELEQIFWNDQSLQEVLQKWFGDDHPKKLKTLARCRFGALNFSPDFDGENATPDYCQCPHRGNCIGENIVCRPAIINGQEVTVEEITILKEISGNDKNTTIANRLGYCLGTFIVKKTALYKKCRFITKQHAAITLFIEGLL